MKRPKDSSSPVAFTLSVLNGKWKLLIIENLLDGPKRFNELERAVSGITPRMLIRELKELEEKKVIIRKAYSQVPPKVEYSISEQAMSLKKVIENITEWGANHMSQIVEDSLQLVDKR
jgi:DNA-binding HxlR family transcriptional regulator